MLNKDQIRRYYEFIQQSGETGIFRIKKYENYTGTITEVNDLGIFLKTSTGNTFLPYTAIDRLTCMTHYKSHRETPPDNNITDLDTGKTMPEKEFNTTSIIEKTLPQKTPESTSCSDSGNYNPEIIDEITNQKIREYTKEAKQ